VAFLAVSPRGAHLGRTGHNIVKLHVVALRHRFKVFGVHVARGGEDVGINIIPACKSCNSAKQDKMPLEFIMSNLGIR